MRMNAKFGLLVTLVCVALLISTATSRNAGVVSAAGGGSNCNVANLAGTYAYAGFGTISEGNAAGFPAGLYNTASTLKMDGAGNYTVDGATSYNGVITPEHFAGTYEVGDDCQVTFFVGEIPAVLGIFVNNRSESRAMVLIPGTNITLLTIRK